jgi:hypothetical protein
MNKQIALLIAYTLMCEEQERFCDANSYLDDPESDPYYKELEEAKRFISSMV